MPKNSNKNINRYKVRGGQMNPFEYQQNRAEVAQQNQSDWLAEQADEANLPPDQAEAARIRKLLTAHGESVPASAEQAEPRRAGKAAEPVATRQGAKNAATPKGGKQTVARKSAKPPLAQKKGAGKTLSKSSKTASGAGRSRATSK
jgi:hypothetical protein